MSDEKATTQLFPPWIVDAAGDVVGGTLRPGIDVHGCKMVLPDTKGLINVDNRSFTYSYAPPPVDVLTVEGVRYAAELFRTFAVAPIGAVLRIEKREDGVLTVHRFPEKKEILRNGVPIPQYLNHWEVDVEDNVRMPLRSFHEILLERQQLLTALRYVADNSKDPDSKLIAQRSLEYFVRT